MAPPTVPVGEPAVIQAGSTVVFDVPDVTTELGRFVPSDGWTLTYYLTSSSAQISAAADIATAGNWRLTLSATATAALSADGDTVEAVAWVAIASQDSESYPVRNGRLTLQPSPLQQTSGATTHAERALSLIEAAIEGRLPTGMESYQVQGRAISKIPIADLYKLRASYRAEVRRQRFGSAGTMQVVFSRPGGVSIPFRNWTP